jgi:hypothetical protein
VAIVAVVIGVHRTIVMDVGMVSVCAARMIVRVIMMGVDVRCFGVGMGVMGRT